MIQKILFLLFVLSYSITRASDIHLNFNKITLEDGLTDDRYNSYFYQDSKGFVWISSIDGLNRYDGVNIKTYRYLSGLRGTNIQSNFFEDKEGNIWFTTYDAINCYNSKYDTIYNFNIPNENTGYKAFYLDTLKNNLWLKVDYHIYKWNIENQNQYERLSEEILANSFNVGLNDNGALNRIATPLLYSDSVRFIYTDNLHSNKTIKIPNSRKAILLEDTKWLFYKGSNLYIFNEQQPLDIKVIKAKKINFIQSIIKYDEDNLLISSKENGILLYNWRKEQILNQWKSSETNNFSLMTDEPRNLFTTSSNYLWTSHRNKGVNFSYINNNNFDNPIGKLIGRQVEITSLIEDNEKKIWVSTKFDGIYVFTIEGEFVYHFEHPFTKSDNSGLWQISKNKKGKLFGISSNAIYQFDLKKKSVKNIISQSDFRFINSIYPNRDLVSGFSNLGVMEIVEDKNGNYKIQPCPEFSGFGKFGFLQMYQTQNKKVFIPYGANELWIYQATQYTLKLIAINDTCNLEFFGFCESKKKPGIVWAGTSKGLKIINHNNKIKSVFNDNSELANGKVFGIVEDNKGDLWLTTNIGLWKYNPNEPKLKPIHFEEADGLSGELFSLYHNELLASNGTIWMGNNKGLVKFHPDSIKVHKEVPKLHLDELLVNDTKSVRKSIQDNFLVLNYNQNTLTFDIKAINLYKPKRNKIHYQLEGFDDDTIKINNGEKIRYTKIKQGNYTLNTYAEDANGHKGEMKQLLSLKIKPPWWNTWPFYIFYIIFFPALIYSFYKLRVNFLIKEQAKKMELEKVEVEMKALRAQMNPHFLFNAMNSIKGLILSLEEQKAANYLTKFSTLLRTVLANSEKQTIILAKEIESIQLYIELEALRFDHNFHYNIHVNPSIDTGFIRTPPLILQPFVENAILHGLLSKTLGTKNLNIRIFKEGDFLLIEIEDNGVGRTCSTKKRKNPNHESIGIKNTIKRIKLHHEKNEIQIIDLVDIEGKPFGTKVIIKIYSPE